ncbi:MAG: tetratricopeptide repeat protein [Cytophaga sp.]|uniref:tetratricopeptide repeat protein n=1 Tax=Cytophaga sp. TaxID=29535 RepID=UPI003F80E99C
MTQPVPQIRSINYFYLLCQILFLAVLHQGFYYSGADEPALWAGMIYLMIAYGTRYFVPLDHRKGMRALRQGKYEQALVDFDKSFAFFSKHLWIDRFRMFAIFSVSKFCYREMAMVNKAFTLACLDRKEEAKALYEACLKEYPKNNVAYYGLKML